LVKSTRTAHHRDGPISRRGKNDILFRNDTVRGRALDHERAQKVADQVVASIGNDWHFRGGDFNADGKADILWRHDNGSVRSGNEQRAEDRRRVISRWATTGISRGSTMQ